MASILQEMNGDNAQPTFHGTQCLDTVQEPMTVIPEFAHDQSSGAASFFTPGVKQPSQPPVQESSLQSAGIAVVPDTATLVPNRTARDPSAVDQLAAVIHCTTTESPDNSLHVAVETDTNGTPDAVAAATRPHATLPAPPAGLLGSASNDFRTVPLSIDCSRASADNLSLIAQSDPDADCTDAVLAQEAAFYSVEQAMALLQLVDQAVTAPQAVDQAVTASQPTDQAPQAVNQPLIVSQAVDQVVADTQATDQAQSASYVDDQAIAASQVVGHAMTASQAVDRAVAASQATDQASQAVNQHVAASQAVDQAVAASQATDQASQAVNQHVAASQAVDQAVAASQAADQASQAVNQHVAASQAVDLEVTASQAIDQAVADTQASDQAQSASDADDQAITASQADDQAVTASQAIDQAELASQTVDQTVDQAVDQVVEASQVLSQAVAASTPAVVYNKAMHTPITHSSQDLGAMATTTIGDGEQPAEVCHLLPKHDCDLALHSHCC